MKILYFFFVTLVAVPVKAQLFGGQIKPSRVISQQPSYPLGSVFCNGPTLVVDVTNPATGKTWMNRNLGAGQVATSSTDALGKGDLYQWGRRSDGHQCRNSTTTTNLSSSDQPLNGNFIISPNSPNDWRSPHNNNLWQGVNGVNNPCPLGYRLPTEIELNNERLTWISDDEAGAFASPLKFPRANSRGSTDGVIGNTFASIYWASTISSIYSRSLRITISTIGPTLWGNLARANGCSVRCIKETVGSVGSLNCGSATTTGTLIQGSPASNVTTLVPYTGGNGGFYPSQSVSSTGVTGLTASVSQGLLANGSGNLIYTITGTPATSGTASFNISIGGQSCTFTITVFNIQPAYPSGSVFCNGPTIVNDVTNPATGKTWMDRNLGASQVATSSTDSLAYGDLYQWGRRADGHQCRNSATTTTLSSTDQPGNGDFILPTNSPVGDWRNPQNNNLWQSVIGNNNPCPTGYRVPTSAEYSSEILSWGSGGSSSALSSTLKLPPVGRRVQDGLIYAMGFSCYYWSSTISSTNSMGLFANTTSTAAVLSTNRFHGYSVRCIKETVGSVGSLNCNSATTTGTLIQGSPASNVITLVAYTGGNGGFYGSQSVSSTGVIGLTASVLQGLLANGSGNLVYTISGTPTSSGTANFAISVGGQSCTFTLPVALPVGTITTLSCGTSTNNGTLTQGIAASGVNSVITYTGGNGWSHNGQTVTSTGVTGLTATLLPDTFAIGSGTLTYTITGTPSTSGTASFALNIGGQSCVLTRPVQTFLQSQYPVGSNFCSSGPTVIVEVINPATGRRWMDRNLGATRAATGSADAQAYGDLYQWGRRSDGHQCRNSATIGTLSSTDQPAHGDFILSPNSPVDWRSPQNTNLWQGLNGTNNPCPIGYRLPTISEIDAERLNFSSNNASGAFASPLKFTVAGARVGINGQFSGTGSFGEYWSSTISGNLSRNINFSVSGTISSTSNRANGLPVRCIKNL